MSSIIRFSVIVSIFIIAFFSGCSGGKSNPTFPNDQANELTIARLDEANLTTGETLIGIWDMVLDYENLSVELVPSRLSKAIGDTFYVDITFFLSGSPCRDCLRIKSIGLDEDEHVFLDIGVRHPFEPINRLDLHVFDLRAMVAWKNAVNLTTFPSIEADINGDGSPDGPISGYFDFLINFDGYTTLFDAIVEPALGQSYPGNIVPFVNMFVNPLPGNYDPVSAPDTGFTDTTNPTGNNVFPMGSDEEVKELKLNLQQGIGLYEFTITLECAYGQSAIRPSRMYPKYFLPEFHRKEAHTFGAIVENNNLLEGDSTSSADLKVFAIDWQAGLTPPPGGFDPSTSPLDSIRHQSDVKEAIVEIPGILNQPLVITSPSQGSGKFSDPYVFPFVITNELEADDGFYTGLVAIRDQLMDIVPGGDNKPPIGIERDGLTLHTFRDFCAYYMFEVEVHENVIQPPDAIISQPADDIIVPSSTLVHFDGSTSFPSDLPADRYEWDFDYDDIGQVFTQDGIDKVIDHLFINTSGATITYIVALRVTDFQLRSDIDTVLVTVNPAGWGTPVRLTFTEDKDDTISLSGDAIAVDSSGVVHVIYSEKAIDPDPPNTFRIKYVSYDGSVVSPPQVISGPTPFQTPLFGFPQQSPQLPGASIAVDSSDELYAVWTDINGIRYTYTTNHSWLPAVSTEWSPDVNPDIVPAIAINPDDKIMITWSSRRYTYSDNTKPMPKVHYAYGDSSGMTVATLTEFNNIVGGEPYLTAIGQSGFALAYVDDNPSIPGSENDFFVARYDGAWNGPFPIPLDKPSVLRGYIGARVGSEDISVVWSDVLASPTTLRFKHYTADIYTWSNDYRAYDDAMVLSLPSPIRIEVLDNGAAFLMWSDTIASKERCLWVAFDETDDEAAILAEEAEEIDPANPIGERQINSTSRDGAVHVIWQDLRDSSGSPGDPLQEIYYCRYQ